MGKSSPFPQDSPNAAGILAAVVVICAVVLFFMSWLVMLSLGIFHSAFGWDSNVSYWTSVTVTFALVVIGSFFRGVNTN